MTEDQYDVIVVGSGLGGMAAGAVLAKGEGKRVLVVERQESLGGRMHHFKGSEIREPDDYLGPLRASTGRLVHSEPPLQDMIEGGLLEGFNFELGMHDIVNGQQSRVVHVLDYLGVPVEIVPLNACGYWFEDTLHPLERGSFPWMSSEDYDEFRGILIEMLRMPLEEIREEHYRVSLAEFLEPRTTNPVVLEFFDILGGFTVGMNSARDLSAGEFMLCTRMPIAAGLHFADGTLGQMGGESFMQIAHNLADVIRAHGGDVRTAVAVEEVLIEGGRAIGVRVGTRTGHTEEIVARDAVVVNVPAKTAVRHLIPDEHLPAEFVAHVEGLESGGAFTPIYGLERSVIDIPGMLFAKVPVDEPSLPDGLLFGYEAHSLFVDGKAPAGNEIIECWVGLGSEHLRELEEAGKLPLLCEAVTTFLADHHPGFMDALTWALYPAFDRVVSVSPTPEQAWDAMLDPACPGVDGLYFVGDSVKNYGGFMDGVAYGALLCADAVSGGSYLEQILPAHQREI